MVKKAGDNDGYQKSTGKPRPVGASGDAEFRGYVNVNLTDEQKQTWVRWSETAAIWEILDGQVADGVVISLKPDGKSDGFLASATQRRVGSPNAGLVVTARGKSPTVALSRVAFILAFLSHKPRWEDTQPMADPDRW